MVRFISVLWTSWSEWCRKIDNIWHFVIAIGANIGHSSNWKSWLWNLILPANKCLGQSLDNYRNNLFLRQITTNSKCHRNHWANTRNVSFAAVSQCSRQEFEWRKSSEIECGCSMLRIDVKCINGWANKWYGSNYAIDCVRIDQSIAVRKAICHIDVAHNNRNRSGMRSHRLVATRRNDCRGTASTIEDDVWQLLFDYHLLWSDRGVDHRTSKLWLLWEVFIFFRN